MRVVILTCYPEMFPGSLGYSVIGNALNNKKFSLEIVNLHNFGIDKRGSVDDEPFGGGAGMVLKPEPVFEAVEAVDPHRPLILLDPGGERFDQRKAAELADMDGFSLLCGRYEGVDERIRDSLVDEELSIGDFVLAGGEFAAMVVIESVARLVPGVLGNDFSTTEESFGGDLLEYPQWTRPAEFRALTVPEILVSGDHGRVERWRLAMAIARTAERRPDLLQRRGVSQEELSLLAEFDITIPDRFVSE